jgi:hypothetical protein
MVDPYSRKPSLNDARTRIRRASEHISRIKKELSRSIVVRPGVSSNMYVPECPPGALYVEDSTHSDSIVKGEPFSVPPIVPLLVGEAIHNLRAALDYLVYELAILNTGEIQKGTQFPMESSEDSWNGAVNRRLKHVREGHQAAIKRLQPFSDCKWTGDLRDLSNADKHRLIGVVDASAGKGMTLSGLRRYASGDVSVAAKAPSSASGEPVHVEGYVPLDIVIFNRDEDKPGSPAKRFKLVDTLEIFEKQVSDVIKSFEPDFR